MAGSRSVWIPATLIAAALLGGCTKGTSSDPGEIPAPPPAMTQEKLNELPPQAREHVEKMSQYGKGQAEANAQQRGKR